MAAPSDNPIQNPRNSFPAWRLPNGTINATDAQLDGASSSCELWEWGFAGVVVAAVIAEIVIAYIHPPYDSLLNEWGTTLADAAIAVGIAGEIIFSRLDARIQTELRRRSNEKVAAATDRAARAETTLIKLITPRRLALRPHMERIAKELEQFARTKFDVGLGSDGEQANFCWDLEEMLAMARWDQQQWGTITFGPAQIVDRGPLRPRAGSVGAENVEIHVDPDFEVSLRPAARALIAALKDIGIDARWAKFNSRSANAPAMHIHIGPKAPPVATT